jgi:signal transduction histidine kinase
MRSAVDAARASSSRQADPATAQDAVLRLTPDLVIAAANDAAAVLLGGSCPAGTPVRDILPDVPEELLLGGRRRADRGSRAGPHETLARRLDGDVFLAELTRLPREMNSGSESGMVLMRIHDLSELSDAQKALRRRGLREGQILAATRSVIFGVDLQQRIDFANPAAGSVLSRRTSDFIGANAIEVTGLAHADGSAFAGETNPVLNTLADGVTRLAVESSILRRDASRLITELSCTAIMEAGEVAGAVLVFNDVTERATAQRLKDEFLSTVSHELRSPLTSIRGSLGMLAGGVFGQLAPDAAQMIDVAMSNTHRLMRLVDDLLSLERLESGRMPMDLVHLDLAAAVAEVVRAHEPAAAEREVHFAADLATAPVFADAHHLRTAITNLVSNAMKFSPAGGSVSLRTGCNSQEAWLAVTDHGRGIPADRLSTIFERFQQVQSADSKAMGGSGLGLSITAHVATALGGRVGVRSELGVGSCFELVLPRAKEVITSGDPR